LQPIRLNVVAGGRGRNDTGYLYFGSLALVSPKALPDGSGPEPAVIVQLTQSGPTRTLLVTNPYSRGLGYRVMARKRGSRKETELPVSSVHSGQQSVMSLGEPFDELVLYEFHLQG
jgi:hypothetical protein